MQSIRSLIKQLLKPCENELYLKMPTKLARTQNRILILFLPSPTGIPVFGDHYRSCNHLNRSRKVTVT